MSVKNFDINYNYPLFLNKLQLSEKNILYLMDDRKYKIKILISKEDDNLKFISDYSFNLENGAYMYISNTDNFKMHICNGAKYVKFCPCNNIDKIIKLIY